MMTKKSKFYFTSVLLSTSLAFASTEKTSEGAPMTDSRKERIVKVFNELNKDTLNSLDGFYHPEIDFEDPLGKIKGREKMKAYYANMYKNVKSIRFEFSKVIKQDDDYIGFWKMYLAAPGLNGGSEFWVEGNSHIQFDPKSDLVTYHRDYFDMGAFIYEQLPVLKFIIQQVKKPLAHKNN
jgi:hypothetical protein